MPVETERGYRVTLSYAQRKVLWALSERGGSMDLNHNAFNQMALDGLQDLHIKGLVTVTKLVGRPEHHYKLTDLGIQVCNQLRENNQ